MASNLKPATKRPNSSSKPTIPVKQTLTSKLRIERGNQLLYLKNNLEKLKQNYSIISQCDVPEIKENHFKIPEVSTLNVPKSSNNKPISHSSAKSTTSLELKPNTTPSMNRSSSFTLKPILKSPFSKTEPVSNNPNKCKTDKNNIKTVTTNSKLNTTKQNGKIHKKTDNFQSSTPFHKLPNSKTTTNDIKNGVIKKPAATVKPTLKSNNLSIISNPKKKSVKIQSPMRKSISAMYYKKVSNRDPRTAIYKSFSDINISSNSLINDLSPVPENKVIYHTPKMGPRRSFRIETPKSSIKDVSSPWSGCWSPSAEDLKKRLNKWVQTTGKPLDAFHHLRYFGMQHLPVSVMDGEDKENVEVKILDKNSSYEDLQIEKHAKDDFIIANEALFDLHKLILDGYPKDQCEAWLDVIRTKFEEVEDKPQYWECLAALEEARGEFSQALLCYQNAVAKGAQIEKVDDCLENLLEKFNILNITPTTNKTPQLNRKKALDARNVFKSTIINFAVQQRSQKKGAAPENEVKFIATPVRRSTRCSNNPYNLTPGITLTPSLTTLDSSVRSNLEFRSNKALKK